MVSTRVCVERVVLCPFSVAHDYAEDFFREAAAGVELHVPLRDFAPTRGGQLRRRVRLVAERIRDEHDPGRVHDALEIDWVAGTRFFPNFRGALRLRIDSVESTRLSLEGTYQPPFGPPGRLFDLIAGRRIARATMRDLLRRLGDAMEQREAEFRAGGPAKA
ncbi:MAG: hypothetical protein QOF71_397 [Candidatus Eremiobacteraeota bacterium]|jgi:hypothetical protein|nr:hypothetical protein [Candidatus Eremiobacteraeota bacterium]